MCYRPLDDRKHGPLVCHGLTLLTPSICFNFRSMKRRPFGAVLRAAAPFVLPFQVRGLELIAVKLDSSLSPTVARNDYVGQVPKAGWMRLMPQLSVIERLGDKLLKPC